jgi:hypothetical protein
VVRDGTSIVARVNVLVFRIRTLGYEFMRLTRGGLRLVPIAANGRPAFAVYERSGADASWVAHSIQVLEIQDQIISTLTLFVPPTVPQLLPAFGLALEFPDASSAE